MYKRIVKRLIDIVVAAIALLLLSPIFGVVALLIHWKIGSPVIFKQERPGYHGKIFKMYKFRTMLPPQTRDGKVLTDNERLECIKNGIDILTDEERLPKTGRILRATSLDELPELWNILIGEMSLVGPRPLAKIYLPYYSEKEMHRHDVRPGLTGLAQVSGRNSATWEKRFEYDLYYVNHCSFILDIKILIKTVLVVFKQDDIGQGLARPEAFNIVRQKQWDENAKELQIN